MSFAPSIFLYGYYVAHRTASPIKTPLEWPSLVMSAYRLGALTVVRAFSLEEKIVAGIFGLVLWTSAALCLWRLRSRLTHNRELGLLILAFVCSLVVLLGPEKGGGSTTITARQVYFAVFPIILWMASQQLSPKFRSTLGTVAVLVAILLLALRWPLYERYNRDMQAFVRCLDTVQLSGAKTLVAMATTPSLPHDFDRSLGRIRLSAHAGAYLALRYRLVYLSNYETLTGHFPLINNADGKVDLPLFYSPRPGVPIDVLVLWGARSAATEASIVTRVLGPTYFSAAYPIADSPDDIRVYYPRTPRTANYPRPAQSFAPRPAADPSRTD